MRVTGIGQHASWISEESAGNTGACIGNTSEKSWCGSETLRNTSTSTVNGLETAGNGLRASGNGDLRALLALSP